MTVTSDVNRSGPYNGNGATTVFDYDFRILDRAHLRVVSTSADGEETDLVLDDDYSVSGVGDANGGSVTISPAPASGTTITIFRSVPFSQETDLENQGAYYAETVERALDLGVMRDQQMAEELSRAVKFPSNYDGEEITVDDVFEASAAAVAARDEAEAFAPTTAPWATVGMRSVLGLNPAGDALVASPIAVLNVEDYRLTGDGDWSAAYQRAYDKAMTTPYGGEIFTPPPSVSSDQYEIRSQIACVLDTNKQIAFTGGGLSSRVKLHSSLGEVGAFLVTADAPVYEGLVRFENVSIVGFGDGSVAVEAEYANGIQFLGSRFLQLEDCVRAANTYAAAFHNARFRDIRGRAFHSTTSAHHTVFKGCNFNTVGRTDDVSAIKIDAASDNVVVAYCDIEGGHHFIEMAGGRALTVVGNYLEFYDGEWFKFSAMMYAPTIEGNWLALSPNQTLSNMIGGSFSRNSIYDQSPGAMIVTPHSSTFTRMEVKGNRIHGTADMAGNRNWTYDGAGTETTQLLDDRCLNLRNLTPGANVVANQFIGGVAFKNQNNVTIGGIGAHYKAAADGSQCYILIEADNVSDAFRIEGAVATAKGRVADATGTLQALPRTTTTALTAIGNAINTTNKFAGKAVINETTGAIVTASGGTAGAAWLALGGTTAHTPV